VSSITEQILGAWDDEQDPDEESPETTEPVATTSEADTEGQDEVVSGGEDEETVEEEVSEEPGEEEPEEEPSEEEEPEEEPSGDEEAPTAAAFSSDDPAVQAFLARHDNDVETALREAAKFESVLGRQGRELGQLRDRNAELEKQLEQATLFASGATWLNAEQQEWVEEAVASENPVGYIQVAVQAGEFELARAVLDGSELPPAQAVRLAQTIDRAETLAAPAEEPSPLAHDVLMEVLVEHYPDMPKFESEMVSTLNQLGPDHPLALLAYSQEPGQAAQGIIGLYEIARAKTATVSSTREQVKKKSQEAADAVRSAAQVSSSQASPQRVQAARTRQLMPGLTLEALEAEFEAE
jgi:hypothetical protein